MQELRNDEIRQTVREGCGKIAKSGRGGRAGKQGISLSGAKSRVQRGRSLIKEMLMDDYRSKKGAECDMCRNN